MNPEIIEHHITRAKISKHYAIRAKRLGIPRVAAQYTSERIEHMRQARLERDQ